MTPSWKCHSCDGGGGAAWRPRAVSARTRNATARRPPFSLAASPSQPWRTAPRLGRRRRPAAISLQSGASPHDDLARGGCGERADGALHTVTRPIALLGGDRVVIRLPWREIIEAHAERSMRMALVQSDGVFRRLAQLLRICALVHDAVMHVRPARVVGRPPDDREVIRSRLELGPSGSSAPF